MSRVGKKPISIPAKVTVSLKDSILEVKGPQGTLSRRIPGAIAMEIGKEQIVLSQKDKENPKAPGLHGLMRTLIANMIQGVVEPWKRDLEIQGVGFRASKQGQVLNLALGFSHPVNFDMPATVQFNVDAKQTLISMTCADNELLGVIASKIRAIRPPEPYKGKGVRYVGERVVRKAGKAAGAAGAGAVAGGKK